MQPRRHLNVIVDHDPQGAGDAEAGAAQGPPKALPEVAAPEEQAAPEAIFSPAERQLLAALAKGALPDGCGIPGGGPGTVARLEEVLQRVPHSMVMSYRGLLLGLDGAARLRHGRPLADLPTETVTGMCQSLFAGAWPLRMALRLLLTPLKAMHFHDPDTFARAGCRYGVDSGNAPGLHPDLPRHVRERSVCAAEVPDGETLECDVVVIGSGAGGAVCAKELAEAGHAVILLEEGPYYTRADFTGHTIDMQVKLYRDLGGTVAWGNSAIPVPIGRTVGGTTTVNSGTCYRMPGRVLKKWRELHGLRDLTDEEMEPHYQRVEEVLGVAPADPRYLGAMAQVIARGCDALGYRHGPLSRNAPGCDGQGMCCFGCPTDAKRSTNVSYVPLALRAGAQLIHSAHAGPLLIEGGRAVGVQVTGTGEGGPATRFTVRSRAVIVAAGALMTPVMLLSDERARAALSRSGQLGRNLSIHPATAVFALMPERIAGYNAIPQGYAVEEFHDEGILMEGVFAPPDFGAASVTLTGRPFMELMAAYDRVASFGFLVEDQSRGRVRPGPRGRPLITYFLNRHDVARLKRGTELLCQIFLAAGAERIWPQVHGFAEVRDQADLQRLRRASLSARDFELTAYHPLGTARMGPDPRISVVDGDLQAHDLPGLYVCDGSVLPTSPAVNPQITIMALCTRGARRLAERLS